MFQELKGWSDCEKFITAQSEKALNYSDRYNSALEMFAVMKQELEEVMDEVKDMKKANKSIWRSLRNHNYNELYIDDIEECAIKAMTETAQVIAICRKAKSGFSQ